MDIGSQPQWFPEYGVRLGPALRAPPASVEALRVAGGVYVRRYAHGEVAVNPDDRPHVLRVARTAERVAPVGGGALDAAADTRGWRLRLISVGRKVILPAHAGLVLISAAQG